MRSNGKVCLLTCWLWNYAMKGILIGRKTLGRGWPRIIVFESWREIRALQCNPLLEFTSEKTKPRETVLCPLPLCLQWAGQWQNKNSASDLLHTTYSLLCHSSSPSITEIPTPRSSFPLTAVFLDLVVFVPLWEGQILRWEALSLLTGSEM